jgi:hypothetical protein
MVVTCKNTLKERTKRTECYDLAIFLAYFNEIKEAQGLSTYSMLKRLKMSLSYINEVKGYINGKNYFKKTITLNLLMVMSIEFDYPFNLGKYMYILEDETLSTLFSEQVKEDSV